MPRSDAGKGADPRPMTPEGRKAYEATLRRIYGTTVKIPPPGAERAALVDRIEQRIDRGEYRHEPCGVCLEEEERCGRCTAAMVLEILEEEAG